MYEFRGATLQEAVHQALRYPALSTKKLAKVAAKFDFTAHVRMGSVLFVGEGNLSFALTMSRKPRVPTSSILATVHEAEEYLTDSGYDNARKLLNLGCSVIPAWMPHGSLTASGNASSEQSSSSFQTWPLVIPPMGRIRTMS